MRKILAGLIMLFSIFSVSIVTEAATQMYSADGRVISVHKSEVAAYKAVGWYDNIEDVTKKIYTQDGRAARVFINDVQDYLVLGWYDDKEDVTTDMVAPDGNKITVYNAQVSAYQKVGWKPVKKEKLTEVSTGKHYTVNGTNQTFVQNWAAVSSVQQFKYKNKGLAFAVLEEESKTLYIVTPDKTLRISRKHPLLGDVISDAEGNFYVVWGRENTGDDMNTETMFISKYSPDGEHIKTTGFVGISTPWGDSNSAKTKKPFYAGNSVSLIKGNMLLNYHGKQRYDGHQSDGLIGVDIRDMSPLKLENTTFTGHSFNQKILFSQKADDFIFASHGDAYSRGFRVNNSKGKYGVDKETIFHFYLQPKASYDMFIVNKTFAQLGGLVETSKGVALVGASAKSLSENAKTEKQNLFVQIFDPTAPEISRDMFVGGSDRTGYTTMDIYDFEGAPQTKVTDYGVNWLTNHKSADVVAPHCVVVDDKIVILWNRRFGEKTVAHYMVLTNDGRTIVPATELGSDVLLNPREDPVAHDGKVYWAGKKDPTSEIKIMCLDI